MTDKKNPQETVINTGTVIGSVYSQIVGVVITDVNITLEFVYINPRDKTKGQVVSRVTLPYTVGTELANTILNTIQIHIKNKKGEKND